MNTDKSYQKDVDPVCGMRVDPHKTDQTFAWVFVL